MVLLKGVDDDGFVFFHNFDSARAATSRTTPSRAGVPLAAARRQVRVTGPVRKVKAADSDAYFATRPPGSRYSAAASPQAR